MLDSVKKVIKQGISKSPYPMWRVSKFATKILGREYKTNHLLIEIDLTYSCNLQCGGCNRSVVTAPASDKITTKQIQKFIDQSIEQSRRWTRIRLLGGEPTLHPNFEEIVSILLKYISSESIDTILEVATNGFGKRVETALARLPKNVAIINTSKLSSVQPDFDSFNVAPIDIDEYVDSDFTNACNITTICGVGLNRNGYYPCAVAAGIDRVNGFDDGRKTLPKLNDEMLPELRKYCELCGHFKRTHKLDHHPTDISKVWVNTYEEFKKKSNRSPNPVYCQVI